MATTRRRGASKRPGESICENPRPVKRARITEVRSSRNAVPTLPTPRETPKSSKRESGNESTSAIDQQQKPVQDPEQDGNHDDESWNDCDIPEVDLLGLSWFTQCLPGDKLWRDQIKQQDHRDGLYGSRHGLIYALQTDSSGGSSTLSSTSGLRSSSAGSSASSDEQILVQCSFLVGVLLNIEARYSVSMAGAIRAVMAKIPNCVAAAAATLPTGLDGHAAGLARLVRGWDEQVPGVLGWKGMQQLRVDLGRPQEVNLLRQLGLEGKGAVKGFRRVLRFEIAREADRRAGGVGGFRSLDGREWKGVNIS